MTDCRQLLADFAQTRSEPAFCELVARYLDLVYSSALRLVEGDEHRAKDVAQIVFTDLARKAGELSRNVTLGGWLHRHTCFVAAHTMRGERRRLFREREAAEMNLLQNNAGADFSLLASLLDETINQLDDADRTAIVLRFFEQRDFHTVGQSLNTSEDAARMRVNRALNKLRELLAQRGIQTTAGALGIVISANAVQSAPVGLAAAISAAALAGTTAVSTSTAIATIKIIAMTTLQKTLVTATVAVLAGAGIYEARQAAQLREQNQSLRQHQAEQIQQLQQERDDTLKRLALLSAKPTPRLPAPPMLVAAATNAPVEDLQRTNVYARFKDKPPKLTGEQVEAYLKANGRKASSLLAAYRTSGDPALLKEAMGKYPNDPQVAFEAVSDKDLSPEQHRRWLNLFEQSAPDNPLANFLSALDYFNAGQIDQGIGELTAAAGKQTLKNYTLDRWKDDEDAYLSAGYSVAEAKFLATSELSLPQLAPIKQLGQDLVDLANAYSKTGDQASAQAALQMAMDLGQHYVSASPGDAMISQLVGLVVQRNALRAMNPNGPYGDTGQTVRDQLNQVEQQRTALKELAQRAGDLLETMPDQEWVNYFDRWIIFGDSAAAQWLVNKYGQQ